MSVDSDRLAYLAERARAKLATDAEWSEWVELSAKAREQERQDRAELTRLVAVGYYQFLAGKFGEEVARQAWALAPPKRRRGYHRNDAKKRADALLTLQIQTYRDLGLSQEEAAGRLLSVGAKDAARVVRRITRRTPIRD